jgi:Flp pilus assembly protein TadD
VARAQTPAHTCKGPAGREAEAEWAKALAIDPSSKIALDGQAKCRIAAGDYDVAIAGLNNIARDETLTLDLAIAYRDAGRLDEAAKALNEGLQSFPGSDALTATLVGLEVNESHFQDAVMLAEGIAKAKPDDLEAQRIYFRTLVITGDNETAAALGKKLLAQRPRDADLLNLNGLLEQKAGEFAASRRDLELAVRTNPSDVNARVNLGVTLADLKDAPGAKAQLEKAIALGADEPQVHFELAKALRALGDGEGAEREMAAYQRRQKEEADQAVAASKASEAEQAAAAGDKQKAAELYREACAAQPQNAALAYKLATVLDDLGDREGERAALERAIEANPKYVMAQYLLGYLDFEEGDNADAERQFRLTVDAVPDNAQAWLSLAATLSAERRVVEAREAAARALRLAPDDPRAQELSRKLAAPAQP